MRRVVVPFCSGLALAGVITACSSEPVSLLLTLDFVGPYATADHVTVQGSVTRTPSKNTPLIVTATGDAGSVTDTANASGAFALSVPLKPNKNNTIELIAMDGTGAMSAPDTLKIVQDSKAPGVASMTPARASADAPINGSVEVLFTEPVVIAPNATIVLTTVGQEIRGVSTLSTDSLTLTFTPESTRRSNSVYQLRLHNVTDVAGNPVDSTTRPCFVTLRQNPRQTYVDPASDIVPLPGAARRSPADLVGVSLGVEDGLLTGVLQYTDQRTLDTLATNNLLALIEIDIDQNGTTGFASIQDSLLSLVGQPHSDLKVEYLIGIDALILSGDSYVGKYTAFATFSVLEQFRASVCGAYAGFAAHVSSFEGDDGAFSFTVASVNVQDGFFDTLDPAPNGGHYTADFSGLFSAPLAHAAGRFGSMRVVHARPIVLRAFRLRRR